MPATKSKLSRAEAIAIIGQPDEIDPNTVYPGHISGTPIVDQYSTLKALLCAAHGIPMVGDPNYAPPYVFKEDFDSSYYSADLALANESDPTGKFSVVAGRAEWFVTLVDGGSDAGEVVGVTADAAAGAPGGIGIFTTNDAAADLICAIKTGASVKLAAGKPVYFETSFAIEDITKAQVFIGLADASCADAYAAGIGDPDHVGFMLDNDGNIDFSCDEGAAATTQKADTLANFVNGTLATFATKSHRCGFYWDGAGVVTVYVDGVLTNTWTDDAVAYIIPDGQCLSPVIHIEAQGAAAETIWVDYIMVAQKR